jgi:flagellar motor switch protein FliM
VLAAQNWFSYQKKGGHDDHQRKLKSSVNNAPLEVRAYLASTTMRVSELLSLQVGDIITTEKNCERDVVMQIEGKNKFLGQIGQLRGSKAIRITRACQIPEQKAEKSGDGK